MFRCHQHLLVIGARGSAGHKTAVIVPVPITLGPFAAPDAAHPFAAADPERPFAATDPARPFVATVARPTMTTGCS